MRRSGTYSIFALLAGGVLSACAAPVAPDKPSWDLDVAPIVRGSCAHCHGELASKIAPAFRFDVCDPMTMKEASGVDFGAETIFGAAAPAVYILMATDTDPSKGRPRMPPPPAGTLPDYETTVLKNWAKVVMDAENNAQAACKKQGPNHDPKARLVKSGWDGGALKATIEISDSDGDQVFTKVKVGDVSASLLASGRHEVTLDGANMGDPIVLRMSDGYNSPQDVTLNP
jgi:hypothetical protein